MKRETITLDARAQRRLYVLNHVLAGELTATQAAFNLELSVRQVRRLLAAYRSPAGAAGLVHGNRDRVPVNRVDDALRARLVEFATTSYAGVNRVHLADLLAEREGLAVPERSCGGSSPRPVCRRRGGVAPAGIAAGASG